MPINNFIGNTSRICIVGAGATGLHAVSSMAGQMSDVTCIGLEVGASEPTLQDSLHRVNIADGGDDLSPLIEIITESDLVFLVASLDEIPVDLLRHLRTSVSHLSIPLFLVTPEPVEEAEKRSSVSIVRDGKRFVYNVPIPAAALGAINQLDGIIIASREALLLRELPATDNTGNAAFMNYILRYPVELISNLINRDQAGDRLVGCDGVYKTLQHGVTRLGIGIASGPNRGILAAEKAVSCLKQQQVKLSESEGVLCVVTGSTAVTMNEFAAVSNYLLSLVDDSADVVTGVICDDCQGENLIVTIMAKEKYSGSIVVPDHPGIARWVTDTDEEMRSIPAFERKRWVVDV